MIFNISNLGLNTVHYAVLLNFLLLLLCFCFFERKKMRDRSYRFFVYSLAAIICDGLFIVLFINTYGKVSVRLSDAITFLIILCHSLCTAFLLEWFYKTMDERELSYHGGPKTVCNILLALSLFINLLLSLQPSDGPSYCSLVFGRDYLALPNLLSFIYSAVIVGLVIVLSVRYRKSLPMAFLLCVLFLFLTPQILLLSNMKLHAVCALYTSIGFFIVHRYYWLLDQKKREEEENRDKIRRLVVMRQILPHFIFNCLSSIEVLCERDPARAQAAVSDLSGVLRETMEDLGSDRKKPFPDILKIIDSYVRLEQMRFGNKIRVEYDIGETGFSLPPLILQPIVENAIKHGLAAKKTGGTVRISTEKEGSEAVIRVEDDGVGMKVSEAAPERDEEQTVHVGISNVRQRLKMLCGGSLEVQSKEGAGTTVTIRVPLDGEKL